MVGDVRFNDLIRIYQIRGRPRKENKFQVRNKNFEEFTDVYREVLLDDSPEKLRSCFANPSRSRYVERYPQKPLHNIKKIHLEMPILGTEHAIVSTPITPEKKAPRKKLDKKDQSLTTEDQITKWDVKRTAKVKVYKNNSLMDTQLLLKQTKQEIAESAQQLDAIQTFIDQIKPPERIRKSRLLTYKSKKKPERHSECINKKYVSTLNTMQQKLKKLEEKYFSKPHVIYKNVRDTYTTSSDIDVLYETKAADEPDDITETLQGIKQELDLIANSCLDTEEKKPKKTVTFKAPEVEFNTVGDTFDEDRNINPTNFSFKKPVGFDEEQARESYSNIIDQSESWFKKYFTKHFDVEQFCKEVSDLVEEEQQCSPKVQVQEEVLEEAPKVEECDMGVATDDSDKESHDSDKESHDSEIDNFYREDKSEFFSEELQEVISSSTYLSREFQKARPSVKVFLNTDNYLRGKYFGVPSKISTSADPSITNLIDNLSLSLKGSIYYKAET